MATFFCGTASFSHVDDGDPCSPSTPRGSRRKHGGCRDNPYSARGLDKFSTVLADLEARREKIMAAAASSSQPGVYIIRFVYSSSDDWVPVIVKSHEQRPPVEKLRKGRGSGEAQKKRQPPAPAPPAELRSSAAGGGWAAAAETHAVKKSLSWKAGEGKGGGGVWSSFVRRPSCYLSVAAMLILFCMAVYGRAFAICCASIWWYAVAAMKGGEGHGVRRSVKEYGRRMSNRRLGAAAAEAAARKAGAGLDGLVAPRKHQATA